MFWQFGAHTVHIWSFYPSILTFFFWESERLILHPGLITGHWSRQLSPTHSLYMSMTAKWDLISFLRLTQCPHWKRKRRRGNQRSESEGCHSSSQLASPPRQRARSPVPWNNSHSSSNPPPPSLTSARSSSSSARPNLGTFRFSVSAFLLCANEREKGCKGEPGGGGEGRQRWRW